MFTYQTVEEIAGSRNIMPKRCAVFGCQSGRLAERKQMKLLHQKPVPLFSTPKNPTELKKWNEALFGRKKKLGPGDFVCQLHFLDEDVETHFVTVTRDGVRHTLERARYRLRDNAIPFNLAIKPKTNYAWKHLLSMKECTEGSKESMPTSDAAADGAGPWRTVVSTNQFNIPIFQSFAGKTEATEKGIEATNEAVAAIDEAIKAIDGATAATDDKIETTEEPNAAIDDEIKTIDDEIETIDEPIEPTDGDRVGATEDCRLSDENENDPYSIENLAEDLKRVNWKEGWIWFRRYLPSSIEFVQYDRTKLQPRIYCSVSDNMEITILDSDKSAEMNGGIVTSFDGMIAQLNTMEDLKVCAGTGHQAETRAADCPRFLNIEDTYRRRCGFERCRACRAVRHKLQRRKFKDRDPETVKRLQLLTRRHRNLQKTIKRLETRVERARIIAALKKKHDELDD